MTGKAWLDSLWYGAKFVGMKSDAETPLHMHAIQGHCSTTNSVLGVLENDTDSSPIDRCHVPRQLLWALDEDRTPWVAAKRVERARRQPSMLLHNCASLEEYDGTEPEQLRAAGRPVQAPQAWGTARSASTLARARNIWRCFCQPPRWCVTHFGDFLK